MRYWLAPGSLENCQTAFDNGNIWGLKKTQQYLWDSIVEKDRIFFYTTMPVGGVIGYGVIQTKFKQNKPVWTAEFKEHKVKWPLRIEFDVEYCLSPADWRAQTVTSKELFPRAGFHPITQETAINLISSLAKNTSIILEDIPQMWGGGEEPSLEKEPTQKEIVHSHEDLQNKLLEIGKLQGFIEEKEYIFETGKIDVVWRRVVNSVPYIFI